MLMTAVICPEAFDHVHFATAGYRDQAETLFRGIVSNGLILIDPNGKLLDELTERIKGLPSKEGQQLQIRLAELKKGTRVITDSCAARLSFSAIQSAHGSYVVL